MTAHMTHETKSAPAQNGRIQAEDHSRSRRPAFQPSVDIFETAEAYQLFADMPGVSADMLDIHLERGVLTVRGGVDQRAPQNARALSREYSIGDYGRSFNIGEDIDVDGIEAVIRDGVLSVNLPKAKNVQPKRIKVKGG